jgi:hypothetical protein
VNQPTERHLQAQIPKSGVKTAVFWLKCPKTQGTVNRFMQQSMIFLSIAVIYPRV